jgi:leader peptidase (prepilin peptidase)/N-methyltransferase
MGIGLQPTLPLTALLLLAALPIGSFLGVIIRRLPASRPILYGRSACNHCATQLAWHDLLPLVSQIVLGFRCRHCQHPIDFFYPLIEVAALMPVIWATSVTRGPHLLGAAILGWLLITIIAIDWRVHHLSFRLVTLLAAVGTVVSIFSVRLDEIALIVISSAFCSFVAYFAFSLLFRRLIGKIGADLETTVLIGGASAWLPGRATLALLGFAIASTLCMGAAHRIFVPAGIAQSILRTMIALTLWLIWLYALLPVAG